MQDENDNGLYDEKEEKYLNPDRDAHKHLNQAFDPHRQAGLMHGFGIFLVVLGLWWVLRDMGILPYASFGAIVSLLGGIWLLKSAKRGGGDHET